jgi:pyruvate dehydrogenase E1 component
VSPNVGAVRARHRVPQSTSHIFSVTSFSELARDAREAERHNRLHPEQPPRVSHLETCLDRIAPIIAATDYVRAYPELIAAHVGRRYLALGTDGFGRSRSRTLLTNEMADVNLQDYAATNSEAHLVREVGVSAEDIAKLCAFYLE